VLGSTSTTEVLGDYRRAWELIALTGVLAGLTGVALGRVRPRYAGEDAVEVSEGAGLTPTLAAEE
jgi:hypothetical protein